MSKIISIYFAFLLIPSLGYSQTESSKITTSQHDSTSADTLQVYTIEEFPTIDSEQVRTRMKALEKSIPLTYNPITHQFVEFFTFRKPSFTKTMLEKMSVYFPIYEEMLKKYNLPDELKYLSMIESALNPKAISYAGAAGLWQFMPRTATLDFGLRIDEYVDERFDPYKSTEAACKYMRQLYNIFGDWELVLAAYNTGPGNVKRAIRRSGNQTSFYGIYNNLHKQTRGYVPQYVAMVYMINHAADHEIFAENIEQKVPFDTIHVNSYFDLEKFSTYAGIDFEIFQKLNPQLLKKNLPSWTRNFPVRVPQESKASITANWSMILDSVSRQPNAPVLLANNGLETMEIELENEQKVAIDDDIEDVVLKKKPRKTIYKVRRGENLSEIAEKFNVEVYDIKIWNKLKKSSRITAGQRLTIYKEQVVSQTEVYAKSAKKKKSKAGGKVYKVQPGDTLWEISQQKGIPLAKLKKLNGIKGTAVRPGQRIKLS